MPACSNGAVVKPGAPDQEWLDITKFIAGAPVAFTQPISWAIAAWAYSLQSVPEICAKNLDPPAPLTAQDIIEATASFATNQIIGGPNKVLHYISDWLQYDLFLRNCECAQLPPPSGGMCPYNNFATSLAIGGATAAVPYDIPQSVYDTWPGVNGPPGVNWFPSWQMSWTNHAPATTQRFLEWSSDQLAWHPFVEIDNTTTGSFLCHQATGLPAPPMPRTGFVRIHNNSSVATLTLAGLSFCFCGVQPVPPPNDVPVRDPGIPDLPPGLCTTDDLCRAIENLNLRLNQVAELVILLQRYGLPFGTVPGTVHSSLSGTGSFAVSRLIGIRVRVTSHTPTRPDLEGNPPYVWDQGWMSILTEDGMIEEKRISQTEFDWLPKQMPLAVTFGYDLQPGTVITFTELQAET